MRKGFVLAALAASVAGGSEPLDVSADLAAALAGDDQCGASGANAASDACALNALQLRGQLRQGAVPLEAEASAEAEAVAGFHCRSGLSLGKVSQSEQKGLCLDDTTFESCPAEIPRFWPHTTDRIKSMRLFKPWGISPPTLFKSNRSLAWGHLKAFAVDNDATFLLGISVSCDPAADEEEWSLAKQFMLDMGRKHFMGLAIGNELELLWQKSSNYQTPECLQRLWDKSGYQHIFEQRVSELDKMPGFSDLPVTAPLGMYALAGYPWVQNDKAGVNSFLRALWSKYSTRFVFSFNVYPYFDGSVTCDPVGIDLASAFHGLGRVPGAVSAIRMRMQAMGAGGGKLWVTETGWSTPQSDSVAPSVKGCKEFSSPATFKKFYHGFLSWDLHNADHVFYFTIRDSTNFDAPEHFGLLGNCGSVRCKLQS